MNERIRELAEQAVCEVDNVDLDSPLQQELAKMYIPDCFAVKFAELIVKECSKVLTQHGAYFSGEGEPYYYAASLIEEHFGVECDA